MDGFNVMLVFLGAIFLLVCFMVITEGSRSVRVLPGQHECAHKPSGDRYCHLGWILADPNCPRHFCLEHCRKYFCGKDGHPDVWRQNMLLAEKSRVEESVSKNCSYCNTSPCRCGAS